ncbi:MAG: hypothetical protein J3K34DRAFT_509844 [Monoraphidium minutum]|nr:MAG: hypothetical protein J3K34DRAFT_509844 [Monoraphidium minutum]
MHDLNAWFARGDGDSRPPDVDGEEHKDRREHLLNKAKAAFKIQLGKTFDQVAVKFIQQVLQTLQNNVWNLRWLKYTEDKYPSADELAAAVARDCAAMATITTCGGSQLRAVVRESLSQVHAGTSLLAGRALAYIWDRPPALGTRAALAAAGSPAAGHARGVIAVDIEPPRSDFVTKAGAAALLKEANDVWNLYTVNVNEIEVPRNKYTEHYFRDAAWARRREGAESAKPCVFTLDLHGLFPDQAVLKVARTVNVMRGLEGRSDGGWLVQIITGRGAHSPDGIAHLRNAVLRWLGSMGLASGCEIGNEGALIVPLGACPPVPGAPAAPDARSQLERVVASMAAAAAAAKKTLELDYGDLDTIGGGGGVRRGESRGGGGSGVGGGGGSSPRKADGRGGGVRRGESRGGGGGGGGGSCMPREARGGGDRGGDARRDAGGEDGRGQRYQSDDDGEDGDAYAWHHGERRGGGGGGGSPPRTADGRGGGARRGESRGGGGGGVPREARGGGDRGGYARHDAGGEGGGGRRYRSDDDGEDGDEYSRRDGERRGGAGGGGRDATGGGGGGTPREARGGGQRGGYARLDAGGERGEGGERGGGGGGGNTRGGADREAGVSPRG